jgi:alkylation response protein AidB-like acyl-CoA dehydrogenase
MATATTNQTRRLATQAERIAALEPLLPKFRERRRQYDDTAAFPEENFAELRAAGLLGNGVPKEFGGDGFWLDNFVDYYDIYIRMAAACSSTAQLYQIQTHGASMLAWHGTPAQRQKYLPDIAKRGLLVSSIGSEADPGDASGGTGPRAGLVPDGDGYRLSVTKHFGSLAPAADYNLIWTAYPGEGEYMQRMVWVLVPKNAPGVEYIDEWDVMGMRATVSWAVKLTDYKVTKDMIIGEPGAWARDPRTFTLGYVSNHVGTATGALEFATQWARERPALANSEVIKVRLGAMSSDLQSAKEMLFASARIWQQASDAGWDTALVNEAEFRGKQALHVAKNVGLRITSEVFDVCGGRGTFRRFPLDAMMRDLRAFTMHERDDNDMIRVANAVLANSTEGFRVGANTFALSGSQVSAPKSAAKS